MKTTFDLPDPLLRKAKAAAAEQGRPLRDLVAEAITEKLALLSGAQRASSLRLSEWKAFEAKLQRLPDGTLFNPDGIDDEAFFESLDRIRSEGRAWQPRDPFERDDTLADSSAAATTDWTPDSSGGPPDTTVGRRSRR